ncbi:MAG: NAD-dependent epimerase/dehydratase family protein [Actinomycetota bacterium]
MTDRAYLVTGGAGFIGSAIAAALLERGDKVRVLDNLSGGRQEAVPDGAEFIEGDLRSPDDVARACSGVDTVFHQAAIRSVPRSVDEPRQTNDSNVTGTLNLLMAATDAQVRRVVYASSSSVYGDTGREVNREDMTPSPRSPYAVSKLAGEHYCRAWSILGRLWTVSLRYFNVFGPGQALDSRYAAVFPAFVSALAGGRAPEVHGDGEQTRDFTYVGDVVRANLLAADADDRANGMTLNVGGGHPRSVNGVLKAIADAMGCWVDPVFIEPRPGDIRDTEADIGRAHDLLGWEPRADFTEAVAATVSWFTEER